MNSFMSVSNNNNNDSESGHGESHAAVDLECLETFHKLETVPMMFLMKCFTGTS